MNDLKIKLNLAVFIALSSLGNVYSSHVEIISNNIRGDLKPIDAAILWNKMSGSKMDENEMLTLYSIEPDRNGHYEYDEFTMKKLIQKTKTDIDIKEKILLQKTTFSITLIAGLGEYNFEQHLFPVEFIDRFDFDDDLQLNNGEVSVFIGDVTLKPSFEKIRYYINLYIPEDLVTIHLEEDEAQKLSAHLMKSRELNVKFWFIPVSAMDKREGEGNAYCRLNTKLLKTEVVLEQIKNGQQVKYPRKVLKTWAAPITDIGQNAINNPANLKQNQSKNKEESQE